MWWYMLISFVVSCVGIIIDSSSSVYCKSCDHKCLDVCNEKFIIKNETSGYYNSTMTNFRVSGFVGILGLVFLFAGFYTIISSCFRLRSREGMDIAYGVDNVEKHNKAKKKFLCKNVSYMVVFFVVWFFPIVEGLKGSSSYLNKSNNPEDITGCEKTDIILKVGPTNNLVLLDISALQWDLVRDSAYK